MDCQEEEVSQKMRIKWEGKSWIDAAFSDGIKAAISREQEREAGLPSVGDKKESPLSSTPVDHPTVK